LDTGQGGVLRGAGERRNKRRISPIPEVYETAGFPSAEVLGGVSQLRNCPAEQFPFNGFSGFERLVSDGAVAWPDIFPNLLPDTKDFWRAFDATHDADKRRWTGTLGKRARLYEILRYYWNNPHESAQMCWDNPLLQILKDIGENKWIMDEDKNVIGIYNPDIRLLPRFPEAYDYERFDSEEVVYL
jgi:hypothetical protein